MTTQLLERPRAQPAQRKADEPRGGRVYAIAFDMDTESLALSYGNDSYQNAYTDIRKVLERHGFTRQQGSVYFGGDKVNAVTAVMAAIDLAHKLPWFAGSVRDIRMLRIEENNDLMPAIQGANPPKQEEMF